MTFAVPKNKKNLLASIVGIAVIATAGAAAFSQWSRQQAAVPALCQTRGAIDAPTSVDINKPDIRFDGWAADPAGVTRVEIWAADKRLLDIKPAVARADVLAALPQCRFPADSGYSGTLLRGNVPPTASALEVRGVTGAGKVFSIGRVTLDAVKPIGVLDETAAIEADGRNLIGGWALAAQSPVTVRVMAQTKEVLKLTASGRRDDVAKVFPAWPQAGTSGFEGLLPMRQLPRGRYRLRLQFDDGKGHGNEIDGPEVINDLPFGKVLAQQDKMVAPGRVELRAWLADEDGIRSARAETESGTQLGELTLRRDKQPLSAFSDPRFKADQAKDAPLALGALYDISIARAALPAGLQRLQVRVEDKAGKITLLPGPLVLNDNPVQASACAGDKLRVFYPGGVVDFRNKFLQLQELRAIAQGACVEVGMRGRVEYLRTTKGRQADYVFDPAFPERLRWQKGKGMSGDSLNELFETALRLHVPLMITLDGGVWADSKFSVPDLDIVDMLEQDERTVQWNQFGKSEPDDALKDLAGATDSPELARMMSLNRYNRRFLDYKKRNLQAAVREIVKFNAAHPGHDIVINFDPDEYINPWFYLTQWYDYNPDTLRQYREWLFHLGPYADGGELAFSRAAPALTLAEANRLARQNWADVNAVEPPRQAIDYNDQWQQLWTQFKRHLVARHYDDLAAWAAEAGQPASRIYTSQTFIQTDVAVRVTDRASGWTDQAGVSIEGAKPRQGHLGAILYGPASRNEGKPRSGTSLIDNIRRADPKWGIVEFHPATISFPEKLPSHAEAYATMQALINGGVNFLSPIWGSYAGDRVVHPANFKSYDVMEGSAHEYQMVWWLRAMQMWPVGSLHYPFGNPLVKSNDGWSGMAGTRVESDFGVLRLRGDDTRLTLVSPNWDARPMTAALDLVVTGTWAPQTKLSAELDLDDGSKLSCPLQPRQKSQSHCVFPAAPARHMQRLRLQWQNPAATELVNLDSVLLQQLAAH